LYNHRKHTFSQNFTISENEEYELGKTEVKTLKEDKYLKDLNISVRGNQANLTGLPTRGKVNHYHFYLETTLKNLLPNKEFEKVELNIRIQRAVHMKMTQCAEGCMD